MTPHLAFLQNLGLPETILILVIAILVFGRNLPQVAARTAVHLQRLRRTLSDLRRESGIDAEMRAARRAFEESAPRLSDVEHRSAPRRTAARISEAREDRAPDAREEGRSEGSEEERPPREDAGPEPPAGGTG